MKQALTAAALLVASLTGSAALADITGTWRTEASDGVSLDVKISPCGGAFCGHVVGVNGDGDAALVGTQIIKGMKGTDAEGYSGGPDLRPGHRQMVSLENLAHRRQISVSGCVAAGLICRSQTWLAR